MEMMTTMIRTYSELIQIDGFKDRFHYLKLPGSVGRSTFGIDRYLNQQIYTSTEWRRLRSFIIARDYGLDLAHKDFPIFGPIIVHHLNEITIEQIRNFDPIIFDPENLVSTAVMTHKAIHFGTEELIPKDLVVRRRNDTIPWKK